MEKEIARNLENKHNIFRTSKQCRERWSNYLNQRSSLPLNKFEIAMILETQKKYGNKWSIIAKSLPGRNLSFKLYNNKKKSINFIKLAHLMYYKT